MLAILLSWVVISFVLLSFGNFFVRLYNRLCKRKESYNLVDTFILGICVVTMFLSISSLWLPSNHYALLVYCLLSILYWILNRRHLMQIFKKYVAEIKSLSKINLLLIILCFLAILMLMLWSSSVFDSIFYHHQNIRWIEEYAVVPGLGNLEDRLAFNSNYMLISAIFTFRFLFGEAIYGFQSALLICFLFWIIIELIRSNFELKRILLLLIFFLFYALNIDAIADTSTDIVPNICVFYLVARIVLYPDLFKSNFLLYTIVPFCLITYKISSIPFSLLSVYLFVIYAKKANLKPILFALIFCLLIITPWLIRNIIVSGYLVYPLSSIDIFNFDWKMPEYVADIQRKGIASYANEVFYEMLTFKVVAFYGMSRFKMRLFSEIMTILIYFYALISPIIACRSYYLKTYAHKEIYFIYFVLYIYLVYWFISAPDLRFASGAFMSILFLVTTMLGLNKLGKNYQRIGTFILAIVVFFMSVISLKRTFNYYLKNKFPYIEYNQQSIFFILLKPYSAAAQAKAIYKFDGYFEYQLNNDIKVYIAKDIDLGIVYDKLPATSRRGGKFQPIETIEARGTTLQEGFRPKAEFRN